MPVMIVIKKYISVDNIAFNRILHEDPYVCTIPDIYLLSHR